MAIDPVWSVSVTRDSLSEAPLILTDRPNGLWVERNGIGPGPGAVRKVNASSPFVPGRFMVMGILDVQIMKVAVRIRAHDVDWLDYQLGILQQAFTQWSYSLQVTMDGVRHHWSCEMADSWSIGTGGQFNDLEFGSFVQSITFNVPRSPIPSYGRI